MRKPSKKSQSSFKPQKRKTESFLAVELSFPGLISEFKSGARPNQTRKAFQIIGLIYKGKGKNSLALSADLRKIP
jgi:hypothetical protein